MRSHRIVAPSTHSTLSGVVAGLLLGASLLGGSARADEAHKYSVSIEAPAARSGVATTAHVKVSTVAGFHINKDYPTSFKVQAPAGVDLPKPKLTNHDKEIAIAGTDAVVEVAYTPKEAGKKTFNGVLSFAVCTENTCDPRRENITFTVDVK